MSLIELLAHPIGRAVTLALVHFAWQGLVVAGALVLIVELCGVRRATVRYTFSLTALIAMVACPVMTLSWLIATSGDGINQLTVEFVRSGSTPFQGVTPYPRLAALDAMQPLALAAWLTGVCLFGGRLAAGAIGLERLRHSRQLLPLELAAVVERLGRKLSVNALPLVFLSRDVAEAMAVGVVRPLVLIPAAWATEMPLDVLEAVIAHELSHLRRHDLWINWLQRIVETVLFYHPAVWWLSRRLRIERELCADELAVAATGKRLAYAQALEQVAHWRRAEVRPALAAFLRGEPNMHLLERVQHVLGLKLTERSRLWPAGLLAMALPMGLWIASLGLGVAIADDERGEKQVKRRVELRLELDGDQAKEIRLDNRDEDKPETRDGDKPRKRITQYRELKNDAQKRDEDVQEIERKIIRKLPPEAKAIAGKPTVQFKREGGDNRLDELTVLVKRLSAQVERLQDEVAALRGEKGHEGELKELLRRQYQSKESRADDERKEAELSEQRAQAAEQQARARVREAAVREQQQAIRERQQAERERQQAGQERQQAERERQQADRERQQAEQRELEALGRLRRTAETEAELKSIEAKEAGIRARQRTERRRQEPQGKQEPQKRQDERDSRESDESVLSEKLRAARELAEQTKIEALRRIEIDVKPMIEKQRAEAEVKVAEARKMAEKFAAQAREYSEQAAAQAREQAEKAKAQALEAVKRAIEQKKELEIERKEELKEKPDKKRDGDKDEDAATS